MRRNNNNVRERIIDYVNGFLEGEDAAQMQVRWKVIRLVMAPPDAEVDFDDDDEFKRQTHRFEIRDAGGGFVEYESNTEERMVAQGMPGMMMAEVQGLSGGSELFDEDLVGGNLDDLLEAFEECDEALVAWIGWARPPSVVHIDVVMSMRATSVLDDDEDSE